MTGSGLWSKIDVDTSEVAAKAPQERGSEDKKAFHLPSTWLLDLIAIPIWLYVVAQLFFFDVDDYIFEDLLGLDFNPGNYRLLFVLGVLFIVVLFARQYWFILAYVVFFPLVVLFWKIPRLIYRTRSWLFLFVVVNLVANIFRSFKYIVVTVSLSVFFIFAISLSNSNPILIAATVGLFVLLFVAYFRTLRASFSGLRFVEGQQSVIRRITDSDLVWHLSQVDEDLKRPEIQRFNDVQLNNFVGKVSTGLLIHRSLYFWAYQLDRYRDSPAPSFFSSLAYVWLFVISVISFWMANIALLKIDPSGFSFTEYPSNLQVLLYTLRGFTLGGLESLEPVGDWQVVMSIGAGVTGVLLLTTLVANIVFTTRVRRQSEAIRDLVGEMKERAREFEKRLSVDYEIPIADAFARLQELGRGLVSWIAYLSAKIPPDFVGDSRSGEGD